MVRALDHLVLPCRDLGASAERLRILGFTVGRRNRHPWGTENHIVQFDGVFLEPIALAPDLPPPGPAEDAFPFAGFLAGLGSSARPSGMIVLRAEDAVDDAAAFARDGIGEGRRLDFSRTAAGPDGAPREVSFSLAFATAPTMPDLGFFTCRQHSPDNFWSPALRVHANGATGITAVTIVARAPDMHRRFLTRFADAPTVERIPGGYALDLGNGRIEVIDEAGGARRFGVSADEDRPARLAAIRFAGGASADRASLAEGGPVLLFD